jgi:hypothetical protein
MCNTHDVEMLFLISKEMGSNLSILIWANFLNLVKKKFRVTHTKGNFWKKSAIIPRFQVILFVDDGQYDYITKLKKKFQ